MKVKITAIRKADYTDLQSVYENPIEHACDVREGQIWISEDGEKPDGLCDSAWESMRWFVQELAAGRGNFYDGWMKNPNSAMISCNDGFRPVSFYLERMEETVRPFRTILLVVCCFLMMACSSSDHLTGGSRVKTVSDTLWAYSISHPDGFTVNITTLTEPTEGVVVAYAATQGCHSQKQLNRVVRHAMRHDGYVGGWLDKTDSLYYFDSSRIFPEDSLDAAIRFGVKNKQIAIYVLSEGREVRLDK